MRKFLALMAFVPLVAAGAAVAQLESAGEARTGIAPRGLPIGDREVAGRDEAVE